MSGDWQTYHIPFDDIVGVTALNINGVNRLLFFNPSGVVGNFEQANLVAGEFRLDDVHLR